MGLNVISNQYKYSGKGPLDAKLLVKTFADLTSTATWTADGIISAYNGMIVAVWADNTVTNNGIYFLHDPDVKTARATPNVENKDYWHKLSSLDNLTELAEQISSIKTDLETLEESIAQKADADSVYTIEQADAKFVTEAHVAAYLNGAISSIIQPKESVEVSVSDNGTLGINEININKIVQTPGDTLVLVSGGVSATNIIN